MVYPLFRTTKKAISFLDSVFGSKPDTLVQGVETDIQKALRENAEQAKAAQAQHRATAQSMSASQGQPWQTMTDPMGMGARALSEPILPTGPAIPNIVPPRPAPTPRTDDIPEGAWLRPEPFPKGELGLGPPPLLVADLHTKKKLEGLHDYKRKLEERVEKAPPGINKKLHMEQLALFMGRSGITSETGIPDLPFYEADPLRYSPVAKAGNKALEANDTFVAITAGLLGQGYTSPEHIAAQDAYVWSGIGQATVQLFRKLLDNTNVTWDNLNPWEQKVSQSELETSFRDTSVTEYPKVQSDDPFYEPTPIDISLRDLAKLGQQEHPITRLIARPDLRDTTSLGQLYGQLATWQREQPFVQQFASDIFNPATMWVPGYGFKGLAIGRSAFATGRILNGFADTVQGRAFFAEIISPEGIESMRGMIRDGRWTEDEAIHFVITKSPDAFATNKSAQDDLRALLKMERSATVDDVAKYPAREIVELDAQHRGWLDDAIQNDQGPLVARPLDDVDDGITQAYFGRDDVKLQDSIMVRPDDIERYIAELGLEDVIDIKANVAMDITELKEYVGALQGMIARNPDKGVDNAIRSLERNPDTFVKIRRKAIDLPTGEPGRMKQAVDDAYRVLSGMEVDAISVAKSASERVAALRTANTQAVQEAIERGRALAKEPFIGPVLRDGPGAGVMVVYNTQGLPMDFIPLNSLDDAQGLVDNLAKENVEGERKGRMSYVEVRDQVSGEILSQGGREHDIKRDMYWRLTEPEKKRTGAAFEARSPEMVGLTPEDITRLRAVDEKIKRLGTALSDAEVSKNFAGPVRMVLQEISNIADSDVSGLAAFRASAENYLKVMRSNNLRPAAWADLNRLYNELELSALEDARLAADRKKRPKRRVTERRWKLPAGITEDDWNVRTYAHAEKLIDGLTEILESKVRTGNTRDGIDHLIQTLQRLPYGTPNMEAVYLSAIRRASIGELKDFGGNVQLRNAALSQALADVRASIKRMQGVPDAAPPLEARVAEETGEEFREGFLQYQSRKLQAEIAEARAAEAITPTTASIEAARGQRYWRKDITSSSIDIERERVTQEITRLRTELGEASDRLTEQEQIVSDLVDKLRFQGAVIEDSGEVTLPGRASDALLRDRQDYYELVSDVRSKQLIVTGLERQLRTAADALSTASIEREAVTPSGVAPSPSISEAAIAESIKPRVFTQQALNSSNISHITEAPQSMMPTRGKPSSVIHVVEELDAPKPRMFTESFEAIKYTVQDRVGFPRGSVYGWAIRRRGAAAGIEVLEMPYEGIFQRRLEQQGAAESADELVWYLRDVYTSKDVARNVLYDLELQFSALRKPTTPPGGMVRNVDELYIGGDPANAMGRGFTDTGNQYRYTTATRAGDASRHGVFSYDVPPGGRSGVGDDRPPPGEPPPTGVGAEEPGGEGWKALNQGVIPTPEEVIASNNMFKLRHKVKENLSWYALKDRIGHPRTWWQKAERFWTNILADADHTEREFGAWWLKEYGESLPSDRRPGMLAALHKGSAISAYARTRHLLDEVKRRLGPGPTDRGYYTGTITPTELNDYMDAMRMIEIYHMHPGRQNEKLALTIASFDIQLRRLGKYSVTQEGQKKYLRLEEAGAAIRDEFSKMLNERVVEGLVKPEVAAYLRKIYPFYHPLKYIESQSFMASWNPSLGSRVFGVTSNDIYDLAAMGDTYKWHNPATGMDELVPKPADDLLSTLGKTILHHELSITSNRVAKGYILAMEALPVAGADKIVRKGSILEYLPANATPGAVDDIDPSTGRSIWGIPGRTWEMIRRRRGGEPVWESTGASKSREPYGEMPPQAGAQVKDPSKIPPDGREIGIYSRLADDHLELVATGRSNDGKVQRDAARVQWREGNYRPTGAYATGTATKNRALEVHVKPGTAFPETEPGYVYMQYWENGVPRAYRVPEEAGNVMAHLSRFERSVPMRVFEALKNPFRWAATAYNPPWMVMNFMYESMQLAVIHHVSPLASVRNLIRATKAIVREDPDFQDMIRNRGLSIGLTGTGMERTAEDLMKGRVSIRTQKDWQRYLGNVGNVMKSPIKFTGKAAEIFETAPRFSAYEAYLKRYTKEAYDKAYSQALFEEASVTTPGLGYRKGMRPSLESIDKKVDKEVFWKMPSIKMRAAYEARTALVDYQRWGYAVHMADALFLYLNAGVQGAIAPLRFMLRQPVKTKGKIWERYPYQARAITGIAGLLAINEGVVHWNLTVSSDDNNYWDIPLSERLGGMVIMLPGPGVYDPKTGTHSPRYIKLWPAREFALFTGPQTYLMEALASDKKLSYLDNLPPLSIPGVQARIGVEGMAQTGDIGIPPMDIELASEHERYGHGLDFVQLLGGVVNEINPVHSMVPTDSRYGKASTPGMAIPTPLGGLAWGIINNWDEFRNRKIIPTYLLGEKAADQYVGSTSSLARRIGGAIGISPMYIDHALSWGVYQDVVASASWFLETIDPTVPHPFVSYVASELVELRESVEDNGGTLDIDGSSKNIDALTDNLLSELVRPLSSHETPGREEGMSRELVKARVIAEADRMMKDPLFPGFLSFGESIVDRVYRKWNWGKHERIQRQAEVRFGVDPEQQRRVGEKLAAKVREIDNQQPLLDAQLDNFIEKAPGSRGGIITPEMWKESIASHNNAMSALMFALADEFPKSALNLKPQDQFAYQKLSASILNDWEDPDTRGELLYLMWRTAHDREIDEDGNPSDRVAGGWDIENTLVNRENRRPVYLAQDRFLDTLSSADMDELNFYRQTRMSEMERRWFNDKMIMKQYWQADRDMLYGDRLEPEERKTWEQYLKSDKNGRKSLKRQHPILISDIIDSVSSQRKLLRMADEKLEQTLAFWGYLDPIYLSRDDKLRFDHYDALYPDPTTPRPEWSEGNWPTTFGEGAPGLPESLFSDMPQNDANPLRGIPPAVAP